MWPLRNLSVHIHCTTASGSMAVCREWSDTEPALLSWCVDYGIYIVMWMGMVHITHILHILYIHVYAHMYKNVLCHKHGVCLQQGKGHSSTLCEDQTIHHLQHEMSSDNHTLNHCSCPSMMMNSANKSKKPILIHICTCGNKTR